MRRYCCPRTYFYPRPPRGGRRPQQHGVHSCLAISIHALREEGDLGVFHGSHLPGISIHALREEGDVSRRRGFCRGFQFLSTPSARRATHTIGRPSCLAINFYPRPPRGGRHGFRKALYWSKEFLSTPSARRATHNRTRRLYAPGYFYPRPPRGGRLDPTVVCVDLIRFLSTPSARRATEPVGFIDPDNKISIHALREEGDQAPALQCAAASISIHALREEGDADR